MPPSRLAILWILSPMPGILFQPLEPTLNVTTVCAACLSFDGIGPITLPTTSSIFCSWAACSESFSRSAGERPDFLE